MGTNIGKIKHKKKLWGGKRRGGRVKKKKMGRKKRKKGKGRGRRG